MNKLKLVKSSGNVFQDINIHEFEAKELQLRSALMIKLNLYIQKEMLTQAKAAKVLGVSQPRISNLKSGSVELFSVGMLINMLEKAGFQIFEYIEEWLDVA